MLMVHHFLHTSPYKMSVFERSVTCSFFPDLYSHIEGEKFEYISLVKIASKGTSLNTRFFACNERFLVTSGTSEQASAGSINIFVRFIEIFLASTLSYRKGN